MGRLHKFLSLSAAERRLLVQAALLLSVVRLGLWLLPFQSLRRSLARLARGPAKERNAGGLPLDRFVWAVEAASRYVPGARTCLVQALAGQVLLVRRGYPVQLRIGVTKGEEGKLEAHAWLESEGQIVIGGTESPSRFTPFPHLEGESP